MPTVRGWANRSIIAAGPTTPDRFYIRGVSLPSLKERVHISISDVSDVNNIPPCFTREPGPGSERRNAASMAFDGRLKPFMVKRQFARESDNRSEEHTSELQSPDHLVCRLLLEKKKKTLNSTYQTLVKGSSHRIHTTG